MTYYADLSPFEYLDVPSGAVVLNVGWLEASHPHPRGEVAPSDIRLLERLVRATWQPEECEGWETCSLCGEDPEGMPTMREIEGEQVVLGAATLFVPHGDRMYAAPSLILHYIEAHGYGPPAVFLEALRAIDPTSPAYRERCEAIWSGAPRGDAAS